MDNLQLPVCVCVCVCVHASACGVLDVRPTRCAHDIPPQLSGMIVLKVNYHHPLSPEQLGTEWQSLVLNKVPFPLSGQGPALSCSTSVWVNLASHPHSPFSGSLLKTHMDVHPHAGAHTHTLTACIQYALNRALFIQRWFIYLHSRHLP